MKTQRVLMSLVSMFFLTLKALHVSGQTIPPGKQYEDMSRSERLVFVGEQARRIAR